MLSLWTNGAVWVCTAQKHRQCAQPEDIKRGQHTWHKGEQTQPTNTKDSIQGLWTWNQQPAWIAEGLAPRSLLSSIADILLSALHQRAINLWLLARWLCPVRQSKLPVQTSALNCTLGCSTRVLYELIIVFKNGTGMGFVDITVVLEEPMGWS